jgi:hypothetical protein
MTSRINKTKRQPEKLDVRFDRFNRENDDYGANEEYFDKDLILVSQKIILNSPIVTTYVGNMGDMEARLASLANDLGVLEEKKEIFAKSVIDFGHALAIREPRKDPHEKGAKRGRPANPEETASRLLASYKVAVEILRAAPAIDDNVRPVADRLVRAHRELKKRGFEVDTFDGREEVRSCQSFIRAATRARAGAHP